MYGNIINSKEEALIVPSFKCKDGATRGSQHYQGYSESGFPIPINVGYGESIYTHLAIAHTKGLGFNYVPRESWPHHVRCEVYRFYMCFLAYFESSRQIFSPLELLQIIKQEHLGIEYLKKLRGFLTVKAMNGWYQEVSPENKHIEKDSLSKSIMDIGDCFNVRFWLFFDQPNPHDETHLFRPLPRLGTNLLKKFEDTCFQVIPNLAIETIQEEEILLDLSGSSSILNGKSVPLWFAKQKENYFSSKPLFGKGTYIQKCPGDTRFSITLSAPHSNSVKLIEKQVALVASEMPWSCYVKDQDEYFQRYDKFGYTNRFFYNRDIEKDGLTKNRKLLQVICKVLKHKYPHWPASRYFGIFDNFYIDIDGKVENPPRGIGLGMSAALTTILQSICFRMVVDRIVEEEDNIEGTLDALFYHDDASLASSSEDTLEVIKDTDHKILTDLGICPKKTKSFTSTEYVLCENYSNDILDRKESYQRSILKSLHTCENVTHAKLAWYSQFRFAEPEMWKHYIDELVSHFGYEFYPQETRAPGLLGGWIPCLYQRVDISLYKMDRLPYKTEFAASLVGLKQIKYLKGKRKYPGTFEHPIKKLFPFATNLGKRDIFLDGYSCQEVAGKFTRLNKLGLTSRFWQEQFEYRRSRYDEFLSSPWLSMREWVRQLRHTHPTVDILPPENLCKFVPADHYPTIPSIYRPENRKLAYLKHLNPGALSDKIVPFPIPPDVEVGSLLQLTAFERTRVRLETHFFSRATGLYGEIQLHKPETRCIYSREWFNPNQVLSAVSALSYHESIPVFEDRDGDILEMTPELFFKLNNPDHFQLFTSLVPRIGMKRVENLDLTYFEENYVRFFRKNVGINLKKFTNTY